LRRRRGSQPLAAIRGWEYACGVTPQGESAARPAAVSGNGMAGRRRPTNAREQAKRKAWGAQWGPLLRDAARKIKAERI